MVALANTGLKLPLLSARLVKLALVVSTVAILTVPVVVPLAPKPVIV